MNRRTDCALRAENQFLKNEAFELKIVSANRASLNLAPSEYFVSHRIVTSEGMCQTTQGVEYQSWMTYHTGLQYIHNIADNEIRNFGSAINHTHVNEGVRRDLSYGPPSNDEDIVLYQYSETEGFTGSSYSRSTWPISPTEEETCIYNNTLEAEIVI